MKRRDFCKTAAALLAAGTLAPHAAADALLPEEIQAVVGSIVPEDRYPMTFRSDHSETDLTHDFYYTDAFFENTALKYDHRLALATLGLVAACGNTYRSDDLYWLEGGGPRRPHCSGLPGARLCQSGLRGLSEQPEYTGRPGGLRLCPENAGAAGTAHHHHCGDAARRGLWRRVGQQPASGGEQLALRLCHGGRAVLCRPAGLSGLCKGRSRRAGHHQIVAGRLQPRRGSGKSGRSPGAQGAAADRAGGHLCVHLCSPGGTDGGRPAGAAGRLRQQPHRQRPAESGLGREQHLQSHFQRRRSGPGHARKSGAITATATTVSCPPRPIGTSWTI